MVSGNRYTGGKGSEAEENFTVQLTNPMLYDRLYILSAEYSVSVEYLVNEAVNRMISEKIVRKTLIAICLRSSGWRSVI